MWIVRHRTLGELDLAAAPRQFIDEHHLVDVVARETVRCGDNHDIELTGPHAIAQRIQPRSIERAAAEPVITKDALVAQLPAFAAYVCLNAGQLLFNRLRLDLVVRRHTEICGYSHEVAPSLPGWRTGLRSGWSSAASTLSTIPAEIDRPGPIAGGRRGLPSCAAPLASSASCAPPGIALVEHRLRGQLGFRSLSRPCRVMQNLSFVYSPSTSPTSACCTAGCTWSRSWTGIHATC